MMKPMFKLVKSSNRPSKKVQIPTVNQQQDKLIENKQEQHIDITTFQWPELDITEKSMHRLTFQNDALGREVFAKQLNRMIQNSRTLTENESLSIAIDASWGMGKSQFIHMWRNMLSDRPDFEKWKTIYYNAWMYDDCGNAFSPMVCTICKEYYAKEQVDNKVLSATTRILKIGAIGITTLACAANPVLTPFASLGKIAVDYLSDKSGVDLYTSFNKREQDKKEFRDSLKDLIGDNDRLVIFVDELDRCRPTYAIETLEVMKHFFNVDKVVFVFALDIQQLSKSIATVYGQNMDASGYLSRFFDCQLRLPLPTGEQLFKMSKFGDEAYPYFLAICRTLKISVREMNALLRLTKQFETTIELAKFKTYYPNIVDAGKCFFFFLFALKLKDSECYANLLQSDGVPDGKYVQSPKIGEVKVFLIDLKGLDCHSAAQRIKGNEDGNRKNGKTGFMSSLISFFNHEANDFQSENILFVQWLERRVEVFMGDTNDLNENTKVLAI